MTERASGSLPVAGCPWVRLYVEPKSFALFCEECGDKLPTRYADPEGAYTGRDINEGRAFVRKHRECRKAGGGA